MKINTDQVKDFFELLGCMLIISAVIGFISHTDNTILAKRESVQTLRTSFLPKGEPFLYDEAGISNLFVEDTLPRLIQYGLVKRYELTQCGTILSVNGKLWKHTSPFFKNCLLTEILVHNKVNGYAAETRIVDNHSKKLFAKISPSFAITFFD
jgi:hypothetical protein